MERYIGKMLDNRYEILEVIGMGGMSVVFKAKCHRLNRLVAIKMLKKDLSEDAEFRRRFYDESQAVAMLSHPNIVAVYDVSRGGGMDYIVMELIDGITLKQYMERRGRLDWPEILHFITQIMKGLSHSHSRGIIHRDIKPQNVMVLRDGTVKVTDFGIAYLINGAHPSNEAIGSVHYTSPEQAKGDYTDNRSDIYSAGVVLYEMLTGRLPFEGDNPVSVAIQHFSSKAKPPREIDPNIPEALEQICMKAMATDRNKRYATADEMLADLEAFRRDPNLRFDYTIEDLHVDESDEEPTRHIPNVAAANHSRQAVRVPPVKEENMYYEERPRSNWWKILLLIIIGLGIGYYAVNYLYNEIMNSFTTPTQTEFKVPNLLGYTMEEAQLLPDVSGIFEIVETHYEYSNEYPEGKIIDQEPEAEQIKKSADDSLIPINVTLSMGVRSGEMPNLIGEEVRSAKLRLKQEEDLSPLKLNIVEGPSDHSDVVEKGCVYQTEPAAGESLSEGDTVMLYVSEGPEIINAVLVPFVGQTLEYTRRKIEGMNLVGDFQGVESDKPEGTILTQSVDAGQSIPEGSTVTFTYSTGPKEKQQQVSFAIPASEEPVYVEIYLEDTQVFASELPGDCGTVEQTLTAMPGTYHVLLYVNHQLLEDRELVFSE